MLNMGVGLLWKLSDPQYTAEDEYAAESDTQWSDRMIAMAPDPDHFHAGRLHSHVVLLDTFFDMTNSLNASSKKVKAWIRHGIRLPFVGVWHRSHLKAPHYRQIVEVVKRMLSRAVGTDNVSQYLQGSTPTPVQSPNHRSVLTYSDFVGSEITKGIAKGVMAVWPGPDPPTIVNGIKVVDDKFPKLRFCLVPMYINVFLRYEPVTYEWLQDLVNIIEPGDFMSTSDDKSGYWQLDMHPDMWQYLGFQYKGVYYCFKVLPFGVSTACWIYTVLKKELYRPMREAGARLQFLIDDRYTV